MYPLCREALQNAENLRNILRNASGKLTGELSVGIPPTLASERLARILAEFSERNPGIQLRVQEGYSASMLDWLIQGELDLAIVIVADGERRLRYQTFASEDLVVAVGPETPWDRDEVEAVELADFKLIVPSSRNSVRVILETQLNRAGLSLRPAMEVDSLVTVFNMLRFPKWASILPRSAVEGEGRHSGLRALRLVKPSMRRSLHVAYQPQRELSPAARLLIDQLAAGLGTAVGMVEEPASIS
jgi:DNA-binding transcriptional LysR family regulator